jgi:hypothetical protein
MRRFAVTRLLFALLAMLAVSADTAVKLAHGIEHAHEESHALEHAQVDRGGLVVVVATGVRTAVTASAPPTHDGDHELLHAALPAGLPFELGALVTAAAPVAVSLALVPARRLSPPAPVTLARPPSPDRAPARLRAPPVG